MSQNHLNRCAHGMIVVDDKNAYFDKPIVARKIRSTGTARVFVFRSLRR